MKSTMKNERDIILADPIICGVLSVEAEVVGVTLEEYIDRFLEVFYKEPEKLIPLVNQ